MKKLFLIAILVTLNSCSNTYYQIYKTKSVDSSSFQNTVFENSDCRISYDFWSKGGNAGFTIFNKTAGPLALHLDKSFYIVNGVAFDYFQARTFTTSKTSSKENSSMMYYYWFNMGQKSASITGSSTSYQERAEIIIPAKTSKVISEYSISPQYFSSCDISKFPSKRKIKSLNYNLDNSPFKFSNSLCYSVNGKSNMLLTDFYVSEITNLPEGEEVKKIREERCGTKITVLKHINQDPQHFYIKYYEK